MFSEFKITEFFVWPIILQGICIAVGKIYD